MSRGRVLRHPLRRSVKRLRLIGHHARAQWQRLLAIAALTVVASVLAALEPIPLKLLTDNAIGGEDIPSALRRLIGDDPSPRTIVIVAAVATLLLAATMTAIHALLTWLWDAAGKRMV